MPEEVSEASVQQIEELFRQVAIEEENYNWDKCIELLNKIIQECQSKKVKSMEDIAYFRLGEIYLIFAEFEIEKQKIIAKLRLSLNNFRKSFSLLKDSDNEEIMDSCSGFINYLNYVMELSDKSKEILLEDAELKFHSAKIAAQKKGHPIDALKMEIFEFRVQYHLIAEKIIRIDENTDLIEIAHEMDKRVFEIWKQIKLQVELPELYLYFFFITLYTWMPMTALFLSSDLYNYQPSALNEVKILKEFNDTFKDSKYLTNFLTNLLLSVFYTIIGWPLEDRVRQKQYFKKSDKNLVKIASQISKFEIIPIRVLNIFHYIRFTNDFALISLGVFTASFTRVMNDLNFIIHHLKNELPIITTLIPLLYSTSIMLLGSYDASLPSSQRISFANKALQIVEISRNLIASSNYKNLKFFNMQLEGNSSTLYAIIGTLLKDSSEKEKYFQLASQILDALPNYPKQVENSMVYTNYLGVISYAARLLARAFPEISDKEKYFQKAIINLSKRKTMVQTLFRIENLFALGKAYFEWGKLRNDEDLLNKSYNSYKTTIEYCKDRGYHKLIGSAYSRLAKIEDRLGNYNDAAKNYLKAVDSFGTAVEILPDTDTKPQILKLKSYLQAWSIIEEAKWFHAQEMHDKASLNYEQANEIVEKLSNYRYESPFIAAWAILEKAESLTKQGLHTEAAAAYLEAKQSFNSAVQILDPYLRKRRFQEMWDNISNLRKISEIREVYCDARHLIETARVIAKKGNHSHAADLYQRASLLFENLCNIFKIEREKNELKAINFLCKAWENMEKAEIEKEASLYHSASELFKKAGDFFSKSRMKLLSLGNALYCSALEYGSDFDKSVNLNEKTELYKKIKMNLRESAKNYKLGGFESDSQWALANSIFFDGIWQLILSDNEIDFPKRNQHLNVATKYLNNALELYETAGYTYKKENIEKFLEMVRTEKSILTTALDIIESPAISTSSIGISAPSCPMEISSPINVGAMQEQDLKDVSEIQWSKHIQYLYLFTNYSGIVIYDHPFESAPDESPSLASGGLSGISMLIQEITKKETKIKIIEQEDILIMLEYGTYLTAALITEENLITLKQKLKQLIEEVEDFYDIELADFNGNIRVFAKVRKFVEKIFEIN